MNQPVRRYVLVLMTATLGALVALAGCTRTTKLVNPPRQEFAPLPADKVEAVIVECLNRKGWVPTREGPSTIRGTLKVRTHTAVVLINYGDGWYELRYLGSEDLNFGRYRDGREIIHRNYVTWVDELMHDINLQLSAEPVR